MRAGLVNSSQAILYIVRVGILTSSNMRAGLVSSSQAIYIVRVGILTSSNMRAGLVSSSQAIYIVRVGILTSSNMRAGLVSSSQAIVVLFFSPPESPLTSVLPISAELMKAASTSCLLNYEIINKELTFKYIYEL